MAPRTQSKGTCTYCSKELAKGGMTKHLASCPQRQATIAKADSGKGEIEELFHIRVEDAYRKEFWLDLEMRGNKTLKHLDDYLRAIWLECCGHLSQFSMPAGHFANEVGKTRKLSDVFLRTGELEHIYDFGTSSETRIKLVSVRQGKPLTAKAIALMARNNMPQESCIKCGKPATHLCLECLYEEETWGTLCDAHTKSHPHKNYDDPIALVNSPRLGMCGYEGPADPPY